MKAADASVRRAEARDLQGVLALYRELRPYDPVLTPEAAQAAFANILSRDDIDIVVCEVAQVLAATCMLATIPNLASGARPIGVIEHVVTLPTHRRGGYARLALEHALALAWKKDCCKVILLSGAERIEAHKLYHAVGFVGGVEAGFVAKPKGLVTS